MARLNISQDDWALIRARWEEDPKASYGDAGKEFGASKQAVSLRAKKEGWNKRGELSSINAAATRKADAITDANRKVDDEVKRQVDDPGAYKRQVGREEAEDKRANVIVKHRDDILHLDKMGSVSRGLFAIAVKSSNKDDWWRAKISADAYREHVAAGKMKQEMERKSWGLDVTVDPDSFKSMTDEQLAAIASGKA